MTDLELKRQLKPWIRLLPEANPVCSWVSEGPEVLDINFVGSEETRVHKIGDYYIVVTEGGGADTSIDYYQSLAEVSDHIKRESEKGNPGEGWEFSLEAFNKLEDKYEVLPEDIKRQVTPWDVICLLTERDDDITEWLLYG